LRVDDVQDYVWHHQVHVARGRQRIGQREFHRNDHPAEGRRHRRRRHVYSLPGAFWFGAAVNAHQETVVSTSTTKLQVLGQGTGSVDSVNVTTHVTLVNGNAKEFDFGTCDQPA
jgi:hypothetical protein